MPKYHKHGKHKHHSKPRYYKKSSSSFYKLNRFVRRHPILSAVISILISFILVRSTFINSLFGLRINDEFRIWVFILAIIFFIAGILALSVWFRRNVPHLYTKHDIKWRNR